MDVQGKTVAVTGKFKDIQRKDIELELARRGAKVAKSVTGKTEILIAGERAGSKLAKARSMGILIVSEAELLAVLKQEATVEVEAPAPKAVAVPAGYEGRTLPEFKGKSVCMTGKLRAFTRAQLKVLLENSGATVLKSPKSGMDVMISGYKWGNKLREAIHYGATVYTEGELLLLLEGRTEGQGGFPAIEEVPCGETLSKQEALDSGEMSFSMPPGAEGELVLKWKKVAFKAHVRFEELHGFDFGGEHQYVGQLHFNGQPLKPAPLFADFYGSESFCRHIFWECGSDIDDDYLLYDGKHGFNCSWMNLRRKRLHVEWKPDHRGGDETSYWRYEVSGKSHYYGDVVSDDVTYWLMVDLNNGRYAFNSHTHPYMINPDNPYGN